MNTFGTIFRVSLFGESHGPVVGVTIDGCPPGIKLTEEELMSDLDRRRSGARGTTQRLELDNPEILSGLFNGVTTGAPIVIMTRNTNKIPADYESLKNIPRPGHADMTSKIKYSGFADPRGGGHFSGRLTWGMVAAGTLAKKLLSPAEVSAEVIEIGGTTEIDRVIEDIIKENDSVGGIVECRITSQYPGLGEPFFDSVESKISHIVFSIPAIKGIEFGAGFRSATMRGSEHNDLIISSGGATSTNNAGGINGGISNGNEIFFRVAVKPTSSISRPQETIDISKNRLTDLVIEGRHDVSIALRMPVIIESAAAIALADLKLIDRGISGERKNR